MDGREDNEARLEETFPYGLSYIFNIWRMFSEDEKRKFKKQYETERKE